MSRFHYWQFLINSEGQPIPDANISVYIAGTDSPANVYYDEFGSNHSNQNPQIITNNVGYFEFWVGDSSEEFGYQKGQKFKLEWEKPGVALGEIDWIDVFPQVVEVDENDFISSTKNKVISNKLAYRWEEHRNHTVQDSGFPIHGIEAVNEYDSDTFPNKLISNSIGKKWNEHSDFSFATIALSAQLEPPHGLSPVDRTLDDNTFSKLISNKILYDIDGDITSIYDNLDLINAKIIEMGNAGNIFLRHSLSSTWTLNHNFGVKYVSVVVYGTDDNEIEPKNVTLTNMNTVTVTFEYPVSGYAVITGNVIEGGPETPPFIIEGDHGSLTGLLGDDHTQYILVDGSRGFTNTISGIAPISDDDLTTKHYVDNITIAHSRISNSAYGDDHQQYIHIDCRRGFRNPIKGKNPIENDHLVTKMYVDQHIFSHNTLIDTNYDNHLQYTHIDGRRGFTHNISGIMPVEPSHLATKGYVDLVNSRIISTGNAGNIFLPHPLSDTWTLNHNFGVKYVSVTIYGTDDNEIEPKNVILTNMNTVAVMFDFPVAGYAVITGNAVEGGPEIPPFIIEGDHGSLTGLFGDDHTQYILVDGSRGFTNTISGITPISDDHLTTKYYVDNHIFSHNSLFDMDHDDHLQYVHVDGRRGFTHNISGIMPVEPSHLATKAYVDQYYIPNFDTTIASIYDNLGIISARIEEIGTGNAGNVFLPHTLNSIWVLNHNFGVKYVSVTVYDDSDNEIEPKDVTLTNMNTVTVTFEYPVSGYAVITGNVIEGGSPFVIEGDHGSLTGLLGDDHTQYALVNGSRGFTGTVRGKKPTEPDHLATKLYVDSYIAKFDITITLWDIDTNGWSRIITHGLNSHFPVVTLWDIATRRVISPYNIESIDSNNIKITVSDNNETLIKVRT